MIEAGTKDAHNGEQEILPKKRGTHKRVVLAPLFAFFSEACSTDARHSGKDQGVTRKREVKGLLIPCPLYDG